MDTDDDDAATLRERVRELEQTVAQQQDTIQQLMPSRRAILAGGAGLVGGAALTGQASAQSAAGQVGTSSEPVDVEAATVTADSVNTDSVTTVQTTVGGGDTIKQIEFGEEVLDSGSASDSSWESASTATKTVTFSNQFDSPPSILTNADQGDGDSLLAYSRNRTTSDFVLGLKNYGTDDPAQKPVYWIAIE